MLETFNKSTAIMGVLGFILLFVREYFMVGVGFMGIAGGFLVIGGFIRFYYWYKERRKL